MLQSLGEEDETISKSNFSPSHKSPVHKSSFSNKKILLPIEKIQYHDNADEILMKFYEKKNVKVRHKPKKEFYNLKFSLFKVSCNR
jgi:hypothetical protein